MADTVDVTLNFNATDNASRITDDMVRKAQQGAQQIEAAYNTRFRAIEAAAKRAGVSIEEQMRRVAEASKASSGAQVQHSQAQIEWLNKIKAAHGVVGEEINANTEKTRKGTRAQDDAAQATKKQTSAIGEGVGALGRYAAGFLTVQAAINQAQKAMSTFADNERAMQRTTSNMRLTAQESDDLKKKLVALGKETGDSTAKLNEQFLRLGPSAGLYGKAAIDEFIKMRQAAHAMGVDVSEVFDLRLLLKKAKISTDELPGVFDALKTTLPPHMVAPFTQSVNQILPELTRLKTGQKQYLLDAAAMYKAAPEADAGALGKAVGVSMDPFSSLGHQMKESKKELEAGLIDRQTYVERLRAVMAKAYEGDDAQKKLHRDFYLPGGDDAQFEAIDAQAKAGTRYLEEKKAQAAAEGAIARERKELFEQAKAQNDSLKGSFEELYDTGGQAIDAIAGAGPRAAVTTMTGLWADYYRVITGLVELMKRGGVPMLVPPKAPATPTLTAPPTAAPPSVLRVPGRATGGPVEKDQPYLVGEKGPEMVVPEAGGEVMTAEETAGMRRGDVLANQQAKADASLREYLARFRDKGRQMQRLSMLDARPGADLGGGGGGGGRGGGGGGGGGDPAGGTRTGTGGSGGQASGSGGGGDSGTGTPGVGDTPFKTPVGTDPDSPTGPAENLEEAYKRGYLVPPGGGGGATYGPQDRGNLKIPASIRYNNPGAQAFAETARKWGGEPGKTGTGHSIAGFPTPVHGLASNIDLAHRKYVGMTVGAAIRLWSGGGRSSAAGFDSNAILTKEMVNDPRFWKVMAGAESGKKGGLSDAQIAQALGMHQAGSSAAYEKANPDFVAANKGTPGTGPGGAPGTTTVAGLRTALEGGGTAPTGTGGGATPGQANRPNYYGGTITIGNETFRYGSGGTKRGSAPYGSFPVNIGKGDIGDVGKRVGSIATVGGPWGTIDDPKYPGAPRAGVQIHPVAGHNLDKLYTAGCFGIPKKDWPRFKAALLRENAAQGGKLVLTVDKSGRASIGGVQVAPTVEETKTAGPAALSGIEQRAAERYKTAHERQASTAAVNKEVGDVIGDGDVGDLGIQKPTVVGDVGAHPLAPKPRPISRPGREDKAAGKGRPAPIVRPVSAPGKEDTAAGKGRPAPVVRPVSAPGKEDTASGKGPRPAPAPVAVDDGLAEGGTAAAGHEYWVGENGPEILSMGGQSGTVRNRWQHAPESGNVQDSRGAPFLHTEEANEAQQFTNRMNAQTEGGISDQLGGNVLQRQNIDNFLKARQNRDRVPQSALEPVIRPRIQQMGPLSMRWSRQAERQRHQDISRDEARTSHTDQGFA